ncbi:methyltransferase domain-containing protein [Kiloniella laminariae]|uniref:Methyltransferase domain-containing protein n=1 Tax=Kiloniella laminariae TaxID=454162 RepID=A0ABT4LEU5_9PROT|nr:class I SAM-dependent methyltransferase [Kiloniella laminariae]MCZ4279614.1 methyltransferase domain-containing protein [Kiloniella laminariae]
MTTSPFADPLLAALYDLQNPWGPDCDFYMALAAELGKGKAPAPLRILDIGCGTGLLTTALAQAGHDVTGLDPAAPMLDIARQRPGGDAVRWVEGTAESLQDHCPEDHCPEDPCPERDPDQLPMIFDLVIMSGHVFQVFQNDTALQSTLQVIRQQLARDGHLAFESRNPLARAWENWTKEQTTEHFSLEREDRNETVELWHDNVQKQSDLVNFTSCYRFVGQQEKAQGTTHSTLRFLHREELLQQLDAAGFQVENLYGSWDHSPYVDDSREIIVIARPKA